MLPFSLLGDRGPFGSLPVGILVSVPSARLDHHPPASSQLFNTRMEKKVNANSSPSPVLATAIGHNFAFSFVHAHYSKFNADSTDSHREHAVCAPIRMIITLYVHTHNGQAHGKH